MDILFTIPTRLRTGITARTEHLLLPHRNRCLRRFTDCLWSRTVRRLGRHPTTPTPEQLREQLPSSTAYGKQSVGQAYNPYTGTYGATHQGSSPTAQWGQSYVSNGNKSATTQHYSTSQGTVASAQTSSGGKAAGTSHSATGTRPLARRSNGDMYAGHDGNVYKNTGSGWQSNGNGSWSSVNTQQNQQEGATKCAELSATASQQPGQCPTARAEHESEPLLGCLGRRLVLTEPRLRETKPGERRSAE